MLKNNAKVVCLINSAVLGSGLLGTVGVSAQEGAMTLEEVVVTASRREQSIQDVSLSIQAFDGAKIDRLGWTSFEDYLPSVSGVGYSRTGSGTSKIAVRGISNVTSSEFGVTDSVSTVGLYLDDIPVQGSGSLPDLSLYDLERIEVLKGPQGTLYGEGAMGGAIRMILNRPNPEEFEASIESTVSDTENGDINYTVRGMVNVPLGENWAARFVGSYRDDSGYIDNVATGKNGINDSTHEHYRLEIAGNITDQFSAEFLYLYDELDMDDLAEFNPALGDLKVDLIEDRYNVNESELFGLTLKYEFESFTLTSATALYNNDREIAQRFPLNLGSQIFPLLGFPPVEDGAEEFLLNTEQESFTQEIRLVSATDGKLQWVVGAFYRDRELEYCGPSLYDSIPTINAILDSVGLGVLGFPPGPSTCTPADEFFALDRFGEEKFEQTSVYGEVAYDITDRMTLTLGTRWFDEEVENNDSLEFGGFLQQLLPNSYATTEGSDDGFISKMSLSYDVSEDIMTYLTIAEGYRAPGTNIQGTFDGVPSSYGSDSTLNYEIGAKTSWMDGRLVLNGSLYFIDWEDVQLLDSVSIELIEGQEASTFSYISNGGDAEVWGLDLEVSAVLTENWSLGFVAAYIDSELTEASEGSGAIEGEELPLTPELSWSTYLQFSTPVNWFGEGQQFYARADYRYVDEQWDSLITETILENFTKDELLLDDYESLNLRVGLAGEKWGIDLFVSNATDDRAELDFVQDTRTIGGYLATNRPRTYGLTVRYEL